MRKMIEQSLAKGAQKAEIYGLERQIEEIFFQNDKLKDITTKNLAGFSLKVIKDSKLGIVSSSNFQRQKEIVEMAVAASREGDLLNYDLSQPQELPDLNFRNDQLLERPVEEYIADGEKVVQMIKDYDDSVSVSFFVNREREIKNYLNTYGCDYENVIDKLGISIYGKLIQGQSFLQTGISRKFSTNDYSPEALAQEVIEKLKIGRVETTLESGKMPVLLTPNALAQIAYVIVAGISGDNIRLGVSPLKGRLNEQIFHEGITLIDDMTLAGGSESARFDDEGTPAQRTTLYEHGVLKNYLLNLQSASALGLEPNGKGIRRRWWKPRDYAMNPTPWFSNWVMEPGNTPYAEMISEIKEGLVIEDLFGLIMGNMVAGEISSDIDKAYKIQDGQIVGRVKDATIGVNLYKILKDQVVAIEDQIHFTGGLGGSGFMYLPHILLKDVNITL